MPDLSYKEEQLKKARPLHKNSLKESGYKFEMKYRQTKKFNTTGTDNVR